MLDDSDVSISDNTTEAQEEGKQGEFIIEVDGQANCQWSNERVTEAFGDVRGKNIEEIFSTQPEVFQQFQKIQDGHEFIYFEIPNEQSWVIQSRYSQDGSFTGAVISSQSTGKKDPVPDTLLPSVWSYDLLTNSFNLSARVAAVLGFNETEVDFGKAKNILPTQMLLLRDGCRRLFLKEAEFFLKEFQLTDLKGNTRWLSVRGQIANIDSHGHVTRLNGSIEEITERVEEIKNRQELEMKVLRVQKMEAIGELAGGIAHDFNNILTSIMGYAELALMETASDRDPKLATFLQEIYQGGRRARDLVSKMLTFSRSDQIEPQNVELMPEVKKIVKMLRASLPSSIEIRIDLDEDLPEVFIDRNFLQQMIVNVCINSRDAMPDGGTIFIRGRTRVIRHDYCDSCHEEFSGEYVELSLEDTGRGINQEIAKRIFEPYVTTKDEGSGMGLAMVHGMIHRQGGHIKADSIPQDGSEIRFFVKPSDNYGIRPSVEPLLDVTEEPSNAEKHILVVDDEVSLVYFLRELLQKKGYRVTVASDSYEAWDLFSASPADFDLVITDQTMPGLSGVQLSAKMLTLRAELPIILCTGYSDVVDESNINQYGIKAYMAKPINTKEFLLGVEEVLVKH